MALLTAAAAAAAAAAAVPETQHSTSMIRAQVNGDCMYARRKLFLVSGSVLRTTATGDAMVVI